MGFKDKVRNNQNAEHATVEEYQKGIHEKYLAERANRGKPVVALEDKTISVPAPVEQEDVFVAEPVEEMKVVETVSLKEEVVEEEEVLEEPADEEEQVVEKPAPVKTAVKPAVKKTKPKKKDHTNP